MSLIADLKQKAFLRKLRKELAAQPSKATVQPNHPDTAKVIAILFPADDADERQLVENIRIARQKKGLSTKLLGFFSTKLADDVSYDFPYYSPKNLNWAGVPKGDDVKAFLAEKSDILYVLGSKDIAHFHYLGQLKPTGLRVGPYTAEDDPDNFYNVQYMVNDNAGLKEKLNQINRIFKIINAKTTATI